jgi:hypothetical protein
MGVPSCHQTMMKMVHDAIILEQKIVAESGRQLLKVRTRAIGTLPYLYCQSRGTVPRVVKTFRCAESTG